MCSNVWQGFAGRCGRHFSLPHSQIVPCQHHMLSPGAIWHSHSATANKMVAETTVSYNILGITAAELTWSSSENLGCSLPFQFIACMDPQTVATITPWMRIGMNASLVLIRFTTDSLVFVTLSCLISLVDPWSHGRVIRERAGLAGLWLIAEACDVDGKVKDVERTTPWGPPRRLTELSDTRLCRCTQQGEKLPLTSW